MDEIAMIMKQLFLKSNLLHIRTNEGEFEVSNPESIGLFESGNFFLKSDEWGTGFLTDPIEWPYGVEFIETCKWRGNRDACANEVCCDLEQCQGNPTIKLARLLPKEEFKPEPLGDHCGGINCPFQYSCVDGCMYPIKKPVSAPSESQEEHAIRFAEWLRQNNWSAIPKSDQYWFNILSGEKLITTNDLYSDFTRNP